MSKFQQDLARRLAEGRVFTVASGESLVIPVSGASGIAAYFAGTCEVTPVKDAEGTAFATAPAAAPLTSGVFASLSDAPAPFYLVEPAGGDAEVFVLG